MNSLRRFLQRGAAAGWLVVDIDGDVASFAHVVANGAMPAVEFAESRMLDPADPKSLERAAREFGAKRFRCTTLLKPQEYQILLVEAPAVRPDELKAAVRWRIKDMIDYHIDDATIDVLDVPVPAGPAQRTHYMYTVAARNDTVRATVDRFTAAGLPLAVIDIPDTAQRNVAARLERDGRGVLALTFDANGGLLTVNHAGELYLSRRLDITSEDLAVDDDEARARLLDRLLVETQRSLDHCERTYPFFAMGRVAIGPAPGAGLAREHLAANLYLPVDALDLAQVLRLPEAANEWTPGEEAKWLKLLGAGLRTEKKAL
jgi:MSHA biogenesis protein MshI